MGEHPARRVLYSRPARERSSTSPTVAAVLTLRLARQVPATEPRAARAASRSSTIVEQASRKRCMLAPGRGVAEVAAHQRGVQVVGVPHRGIQDVGCPAGVGGVEQRQLAHQARLGQLRPRLGRTGDQQGLAGGQPVVGDGRDVHDRDVGRGELPAEPALEVDDVTGRGVGASWRRAAPSRSRRGPRPRRAARCRCAGAAGRPPGGDPSRRGPAPSPGRARSPTSSASTRGRPPRWGRRARPCGRRAAGSGRGSRRRPAGGRPRRARTRRSR